MSAKKAVKSVRARRWSLLSVVVTAISLASLAGPARAQAVAAERNHWVFNPPLDTFRPSALLDLRHMNERVAGEHGFVRLSRHHNNFALGSGKRVRFWAVNEYVQGKPGAGPVMTAARFLAKHGVNMVRFHAELYNATPGARITDVNQAQLHQAWKLVAAMKKQGIYTLISPYWAVAVHPPASWKLPGHPKDVESMLFWDPRLQYGYKAWLRALLTRKNPYTGIPLGRDPALAIISLQNEDSMLWWGFQGTIQMPSNDNAERLEIEHYYAQWLIHKYGSLKKALKAWDGVKAPGDDFKHGIAGMFINWYWTQKEHGGMAKRLADQLHFVALMMHRFNHMMTTYIHRTLGARQLVNAGNWRTVDPVKLQDVERWTYTATNIVAINRYTGGVVTGNPGYDGWAVVANDHYTNMSSMLNPRSIPVNYKQVIGYPSMITEGQWVLPDKYESEGPFLISVYSSLSGVNNFFWFSIDSPEWQQPFGMAAWHPPMAKWDIGTPEQLGQFSAAAILYRDYLVKEGKPAVIERRKLHDMWDEREPIIAETPGFDPNRDKGLIAPQSNIKHGVNPLAFLVGPVLTSYTKQGGKSKVEKLSSYINEHKKIVKSNTGQIVMNYGVGVCTVNAPAAQGASGFLGKMPTIKLRDVTIHCANKYATIMVVAMDKRPIASSRKILVQVGTICRPTGWKSEPYTLQVNKKAMAGHRVVSTGHNPWQIVDTHATITVRARNVHVATLLDVNGYKLKNVPMTGSGSNHTIKLPKRTMYMILH